MKKPDPFYLSTRWRKKRDRILRRDSYLCQVSKRYGKMRAATTVHHIFPRDEFPEYEWQDWNLIAVCTEAHDTLHNRANGRLSAAGIDLANRTARRIDIPPYIGSP